MFEYQVVERARLCVATALYGFYGGLVPSRDSVPSWLRFPYLLKVQLRSKTHEPKPIQDGDSGREVFAFEVNLDSLANYPREEREVEAPLTTRSTMSSRRTSSRRGNYYWELGHLKGIIAPKPKPQGTRH